MKTIIQIFLIALLIGLVERCKSNIDHESLPPPIPSMTFIIENKTDHEAVMSWWDVILQERIINVKPDTNLTVLKKDRYAGTELQLVLPFEFGSSRDTVFYYYDSVRILLGDESRLSLPGKCEDPNNILCAANYVKTGTDTSDIYTFTIR